MIRHALIFEKKTFANKFYVTRQHKVERMLCTFFFMWSPLNSKTYDSFDFFPYLSVFPPNAGATRYAADLILNTHVLLIQVSKYEKK